MGGFLPPFLSRKGLRIMVVLVKGALISSHAKLRESCTQCLLDGAYLREGIPSRGNADGLKQVQHAT